jgi:hypothetical protein
MRTDGIRSLFQTIARTVGAARFLEREAEPRIRRAVSRKFEEVERIADDTEAQLTRMLHQSGVPDEQIAAMKTGQRRVRER